jgi:hypothetical protein
MPPMRAFGCLLVVGSLSLLSSSCETEGCLAGEAGCVVPSPCAELDFECADPSVELLVISSADQVPGGLDSMGAVGDFLLRNARVEVVIDALEHPSHLAPSGGAILDMANRDRDDDAINHIFQAVGALPTDAVVYERSRVIEGAGFVALQLEGHLVGDRRQRAYTRYELRACEPGIRVRTEIINDGDDTVVWSNADGYWWGGRSMMPFSSSPGEGFFHPRFGLGTINDVFRDIPFVVGSSHSAPASAIATVPCNVRELEGFQSGQVSANGTKRRIIAPREYEIYERFIAVRPGAGAAPGVDIALELRRQLHGEPFGTVGGVVVLDGGRRSALGDQGRAAVLISEGTLADPPEARTPWTEVVPRTDGTFEARVPAGRTYVIEVIAFGRSTLAVQKDVGDAALDVGELRVPASGAVTIGATIDGTSDVVHVFVEPADAETAARVASQYFGTGPVCAPLLGPPFGGSPACNRIVVDSAATIDFPEGRYDLFAAAGPFATVGTATIEVAPASTQEVTFALTRIPPPAGTLSADFHVHGAASFDSTLPDLDRVRAFLAANVDVIAATDHDAVWDYAQAIEALDARRRLVLISGLETTGQILFKLHDSVYFPQVIGHWNFWPVPFDEEAPRRGAPWDELVEPGLLFGRAAERGFDTVDGVIQLNHPWADLEFGRDLGFLRALGVRLQDSKGRPQELPRTFDGSGPSHFFRTPEGSAFSNADFHTQEVMNGTDNAAFHSYRALWHWQLSQGVARAGTANSDSHSLVDNVLGTPRNLVFTSTTREAFNQATFNADVRAGRMIGTNGPIIEAEITSGNRTFRPSLDAFSPSPGAALRVRVHAIAWVPVQEVRVLVNGVPLIFHEDELNHPADPRAAIDVVRLDKLIPLAELLPTGTKDAWIVIEAGAPLARTGDLDCDGIPDTTDNNGDTEIDYRDVDRNGDGIVDATDSEKLSGPEPCADNYGATASVKRPGFGPLRNPPPPPRDDPFYPFYAVTPGGYPLAFTNPFLLDINADGTFSGPGF